MYCGTKSGVRSETGYKATKILAALDEFLNSDDYDRKIDAVVENYKSVASCYSAYRTAIERNHYGSMAKVQMRNGEIHLMRAW